MLYLFQSYSQAVGTKDSLPLQLVQVNNFRKFCFVDQFIEKFDRLYYKAPPSCSIFVQIFDKMFRRGFKNHYVTCNQKPVYWPLLKESVCSFTISRSLGKAIKFHPLDIINCTLVFYFYIYLIDVYSPDGKCGGDYRKCIGRKVQIF